MVFFILTILIFVGLGLVWRSENKRKAALKASNPHYHDYDDMFLPVLFSLIAVAFVGFAVTLPAMIFGTDYKAYTYLEALDDSTKTEGSFFLGGGSIDESPVYFFYYQTGGGFKRGWISADGTQIKYKDGQAYIEYEMVKASRAWTPFPVTETKSRTIYVPKGSIKQDFTLDNRN